MRPWNISQGVPLSSADPDPDPADLRSRTAVPGVVRLLRAQLLGETMAVFFAAKGKVSRPATRELPLQPDLRVIRELIFQKLPIQQKETK